MVPTVKLQSVHDAGRLYPAKAIGEQQQHKQEYREPDPQTQCLYRAVAAAFVAHQKNECGREAGDDQDEGNGDDNFHDGLHTALTNKTAPMHGKHGKGAILMRLHFRLRVIPLIATALVCAIGISLGNWQLRRAEEKRGLQQEMMDRANFDALNADTMAPDEIPEEFRRIVAYGEFQRDWAVYLDNRPLHGRSGFYLLMPLKLAGSDRAVLVQRGWFPRDVRDPTRLPVIPVPTSPVHLEGRVRLSAGRLMQLGEPVALAPGAIVQNIEVADVARASKLPLPTFIIEQTSDTGDGLIRDWPLPSTGIDTHRGYAVQWYALSAAALIFFIFTGFRRASH